MLNDTDNAVSKQNKRNEIAAELKNWGTIRIAAGIRTMVHTTGGRMQFRNELARFFVEHPEQFARIANA